MKRTGLLFGPLAAAIFMPGVVGLAVLVPSYSHVRQTVSEIGEAGSPAQLPFTVLLLAIATCVALFAAALRAVTRDAGHSAVPAYFVGCMAISIAGVGLFPFPHPLHNIFGISELIGYQAPVAFALSWRNDLRAKGLVACSWLLFAVILIAIVLNLSSLDPHGSLWQQVRPVIGIAQRALFGAWFLWCALIGIVLRRVHPLP